MGQAVWKDLNGIHRWGNSNPNENNKKGLMEPTFDHGYTTVHFDTEPINVNDSFMADTFGVPRPTVQESNDSSKMFFYFWFHRIGWIVLFALCFIGVMISVSMIDSGLSSSWSSHGARRLNDRNVPISSVSTKSLRLETPTFTRHVGNSTTCTPAIWNGKTFFTTYDGKITALKSDTFEFIWEIDICVGLYGQPPLVCNAALALQMYTSVATPTVWGDYLVVSIKQPADIVIISQSTGQIVKKVTLDDHPFAEIVQSGTVWSDALYVGTSISDVNIRNEVIDGCTFIGHFYKVKLDDNVDHNADLEIVWSKSVVNPNDYGVPPGGASQPEHTDFFGVSVKGSSPPVSSKEGLVYFTTSHFSCGPYDLMTCLYDTPYAMHEQECYSDSRWKHASFNSVVALDMDTGYMVWFERLIGYKTWDMTCGPNHIYPGSNNNNNNNNNDNGDVDSLICNAYNTSCPFRNHKTANCPSVTESEYQDYNFVSDPALQIHAEGHETLYVLQQSGIIYSLKAERSVDNHERFIWATHVTSGSGMGGLAADKEHVYFTVSNGNQDGWYVDDSYIPTSCGGWGALQTKDGLAAWYSAHPLCNANYDYFWKVENAGSFAPPTVTNDVILIASSDKPVGVYNLQNSNCSDIQATDPGHFGGHLYAVSTKTGEVSSSYQSGVSFFKQGLSLHDRCIYVGDGYLASEQYEVGSQVYGWCVNTRLNSPCDCDNDNRA